MLVAHRRAGLPSCAANGIRDCASSVTADRDGPARRSPSAPGMTDVRPAAERAAGRVSRAPHWCRALPAVQPGRRPPRRPPRWAVPQFPNEMSRPRTDYERDLGCGGSAGWTLAGRASMSRSTVASRWPMAWRDGLLTSSSPDCSVSRALQSAVRRSGAKQAVVSAASASGSRVSGVGSKPRRMATTRTGRLATGARGENVVKNSALESGRTTARIPGTRGHGPTGQVAPEYVRVLT